MTALGLVAVVVLIAATAFFVAAEFSMVAVERSRLEAMAAEGNRAAQAALVVHRRLSFHLSGAQLGLTIVSLVLGFVAEPTLARAIQPLLVRVLADQPAHAVAVGLALALATVLSMVVGELIPKNLVLARPVRAALLLARPLRLFSAVLGPFIRLGNGTANSLVRRFGIEPLEELASARSLEELAVLIRSSAEEGKLEGEQAALLTRSIRFGEKTAAEALVPRLAVQAVSSDASITDLVAAAVASGFSRFPVYGADLDDLVGLVHVKDIYRLLPAARGSTSVSAIMTEPLAVPETRSLRDVFDDLRRTGLHLAVVVDEHGGTTGIITMEDLLEEIVGEIADEHDVPTVGVQPGSTPGAWLLAGTLHTDEVADACGFVMPDGEYDTIAGFVLDRLGHIPEPGERTTVGGWTFEVVTRDRLRIATVRVTMAPARIDGSGGNVTDGQGAADDVAVGQAASRSRSGRRCE